jgi:hypothetical protein
MKIKRLVLMLLLLCPLGINGCPTWWGVNRLTNLSCLLAKKIAIVNNVYGQLRNIDKFSDNLSDLVNGLQDVFSDKKLSVSEKIVEMENVEVNRLKPCPFLIILRTEENLKYIKSLLSQFHP